MRLGGKKTVFKWLVKSFPYSFKLFCFKGLVKINRKFPTEFGWERKNNKFDVKHERWEKKEITEANLFDVQFGKNKQKNKWRKIDQTENKEKERGYSRDRKIKFD